MRAVEDSLRRLDTDCIDLYQVHRPRPDTDIDETLGALTDLVQQGKVRYIGSSSFSARADRRGPVGGPRAAPGALPHRAAALLAARPQHRARRAPDRAAPRHGHPHLQPARRRLADGPLDAPTARRPRRRGGDSPRASTCRCPRTSASSRPSSSSRKVADDAGLSLIELAIAFVVNHPAVTSAIIGPRTMEQLDSQLPAAGVTLDAAVLDRIDEIVTPGVEPQPRRHQLRRAGARTGPPPPLATRRSALRRPDAPCQRRVPTDTRYSSSKRAGPSPPRFHSLGERFEGRVELGGAAVAVRVLSRRDRRAVEGPEVLGERGRRREDGDLQDLAAVRVERRRGRRTARRGGPRSPSAAGAASRAAGAGRTARAYGTARRSCPRGSSSAARRCRRAWSCAPARRRPLRGRARTSRRSRRSRRRRTRRRTGGSRRRPRSSRARGSAARARRRPASSNSGVRSSAVTTAPAAAAGSEALPVPAATSSTVCPGSMPEASTMRVAERQQPGLHHRGVVAGRPDRAMAGLELRIS